MGMAAGHGGTTRAVQVTASRVGTIDLQGVPGQLTIVGTGSGQVMLTGQLHGTGGAPAIETRLERAAGVWWCPSGAHPLARAPRTSGWWCRGLPARPYGSPAAGSW